MAAPRGDEDVVGGLIASRDLARVARQQRQLAAVDVARLRRRYRAALFFGWALSTALFTSALVVLKDSVLAAEVFFFATTVGVLVLPLIGRGAVPQWLLQRQLSAGDQDAALTTGHLSRPLAALVQSTRLLRLAIEVAEVSDSDAVAAIGAWIRQVEALEAPERAVLAQLGLSAGGIEDVLLEEHVVEPHGTDAAARARARRRQMEVIAEQLEGFEAALLRYDPDPYR